MFLSGTLGENKEMKSLLTLSKASMQVLFTCRILLILNKITGCCSLWCTLREAVGDKRLDSSEWCPLYCCRDKRAFWVCFKERSFPKYFDTLLGLLSTILVRNTPVSILRANSLWLAWLYPLIRFIFFSPSLLHHWLIINQIPRTRKVLSLA